jgi:DNA adenine methylase
MPQHQRYVEPFVGGGAVLYQVAPTEGLAGDICAPLIQLWEYIKCDPGSLALDYQSRWEQLQKEGPAYYYRVRDRFNKTHDPSDLLFLSRTCVNGLIRFNRRGEFNNSLHLTRPGIHPSRLADILVDWSARIRNTVFVCQDYRDTLSCCGAGDLLYLDPPYLNTRGRYYGGIDRDAFFEAVGSVIDRGALVMLSYDGRAGDMVYSAPVPTDLFPVQLELISGNSPFRKTQSRRTVEVRESLYLSFEPPETYP